MPKYATPGKVFLNLRVPAGEIEIQTWDGTETRVDLEPLRDDEATREAVAAARLESQDAHDGHTIVVDVPTRRGLFGRQPEVSLRVRAPHGARVSCKSRSADVRGSGRFADVDVKSASGDVDFPAEIEGGASVNSASGDIHLGRVRGAVSVNTASGDLLVERGEGAVDVNAVSGDVWIRESAGEVRVHTVSGDQKHDAVSGGRITAQAVSGDVSVGICQGTRVYLDIRSISGDTHSALTPTDAPGEGEVVEVRVNTVSGDVHLGRAPAAAKV